MRLVLYGPRMTATELNGLIIGTALEIGSVYVKPCLGKAFKEFDLRTT